MEEKTFAERVADAARYMDGVKPDWWSHVDPVKLNLMSASFCICGQNGLDWEEHHWNHYGLFSSRRYEPFWLEEIAKRMPVPAPELVPA